MWIKLSLKTTTNVNHTRTSGSMESYNRTLLSSPRLYVTDNKNHRDTLVQPLIYAYNCQPRRSTNVSPFSLTLTRHLLGPVTNNRPTVPPSDALKQTTPKTLRLRVLAELHKISLSVLGNLRQNQCLYKNVMTQTFKWCHGSLLDNWCTWTVHYWSLYLPTAMLTCIINY